jgi:hypothetical protein
VTIVSANPETLDSLQGYLRDAGISASSRRDLAGTKGMRRAGAFIIFPDDFAWDQVVAMLAELATRHPEAIPLLVTAHPQRFDGALVLPSDVVILPRPVWAWTILDTLRAHAVKQETSGAR